MRCVGGCGNCREYSPGHTGVAFGRPRRWGQASGYRGTEVPKSPTIDYFAYVLAGVLRAGSADIQIEILKRGYFPEGGGEVVITVKKRNLKPILVPNNVECSFTIVSASSNLPDNVAERQASAAAKSIHDAMSNVGEIILDRRSGLSTGSSCTIWRGSKGACALGKRGIPAEKVGSSAACTMLEEVKSPGDVDVFLSDQLLMPLALFGGSYTTGSLSSHAETTLWLLGKFGYDVTCNADQVVEFSA